MKRKINYLKPISFIGLAFGLSTHAYADHPGKILHDNADCMKCHTSKPYDPAKTTSWPKLVQTVQFCNDNLNAGMFEDEIEQLSDYLNQTYYKYPKE